MLHEKVRKINEVIIFTSFHSYYEKRGKCKIKENKSFFSFSHKLYHINLQLKLVFENKTEKKIKFLAMFQ
jgi:hypothetical protein